MAKICSKCGIYKTKFYKNKLNSDGLQSQCSDCHLVYTRQSLKRFNARNPGYNTMKTRERRRKNPGEHCCLETNRRLAKVQRTPLWLTVEQRKEIKQYYADASYLTAYTKVKIEVDHVVPLQGRVVSGLHVPWNLQLLTKAENCAKNNNW